DGRTVLVGAAKLRVAARSTAMFHTSSIVTTDTWSWAMPTRPLWRSFLNGVQYVMLGCKVYICVPYKQLLHDGHVVMGYAHVAIVDELLEWGAKCGPCGQGKVISNYQGNYLNILLD
ncbi:unnamed protein product, partial [Ostreobium quekettii]